MTDPYLSPEDHQLLREMDERVREQEGRRAKPIAPAMDQIIPQSQAVRREPPPVQRDVVYIFERADLESGIPPEYVGAELAQPVLAAISDHAAMSIALMGPPGTGKTRQAWAMLRHLRQIRCGHRVGQQASLPPERAVNRATWLKRVLGDILRVISESADILPHRYDRDWLDAQARYHGWLVVDDIGFAAPTEWAREAIYHIANVRRAHHLRSVWTSNMDGDALRSAYSPAIASRILGGCIIEVSGADRRLQ